MVIGLLPDAATAEALLNNLAEAEFNLADVSVLMRDARQRAAIADDAGPLKGTDGQQLADRLVKTGLARREAEQYAEAVDHGKVLVAIAASERTEAVAYEMLQDHAAQLIRGVN
jgi:hypothetical protein